MLIKEFLNSVCNQIKYDTVKTSIKEELTNHIEEAKEAFMEDGMQENEAEEKAVSIMGNAEEIGQRLNKIHSPKLDWKLIIIVVLLLVFSGIVAYIRATSTLLSDNENSLFKFLIFAIVGTVLGSAIYFYDYKKLSKYPIIIFCISTVFIIVTKFFGITINGSTRWISIFGINIFTPLISTVLYIISFVGILDKIKKHERPNILTAVTMLFFIMISIFALSIVDSLLYGVILFMVYLVLATIKFLSVDRNDLCRTMWIGVLSITLILSCICINLSIYNFRFARFEASFFPERDPQGGGWIGVNQIEVLESAKPFGSAENMSNALKLFEEGTEFAFTSLLAHFGWVPSITMTVVVLVFCLKLIINSLTIKDSFGKLLILGFATFFIIQIIWNLLMNVNLAIKSSVQLPFISYGNVNLIVNMAITSLILSIYRKKDIYLN